MIGPTPVSSLLHAATMVTAGIFIVLTIIPKFYFNLYFIKYLFIIISLLTILLGGFSAIYITDIKKIIALSTMSQLAYMLIGYSIGDTINSYFHLFIHGFFKALLFITAGIIIHSLNNEQDIRKINNLLFKLPITYIYLLIGTLTIIA
jgi:NADH-quinone oxidoreductase subunit L